jgi:hypothetical protein
MWGMLPRTAGKRLSPCTLVSLLLIRVSADDAISPIEMGDGAAKLIILDIRHFKSSY